MGERRILTTCGEERHVGSAAIDFFAGRLRANCSRAKTPAMMLLGRYGTG
jgi:hypothetical protein